MSIDETGSEKRADGTALPPDQMRAVALRQLRKQADFRRHVLIYLAVNTLLVVVWAWTGVPMFWPIFPMVGWGIGIAANAWDAYGRKPVTEEQLQHEIRRLRH